MLYFNLFMGFLRAGLLCFGGGPASIPFVHREVVTRYQWMTDEEFAEVVAIGNTLPGPINTKMAGYIGFRVGGFGGLIVALSAMVLPTAVLMIVLMSTLTHFSDYPWARGMTRAMVPVVGVMLAVIGWQFLSLAFKAMKWPIVIAHLVVGAVWVGVLNMHPAFLILAVFVWAMFGHKIVKPKEGGEE